MKRILFGIRHFFIGKHHKYINGAKGIISIFLACLLVPFAVLADMLVESGRYSQSMSLAEESVANAEMSTLSDYDEYLLERFGLLAVSQNKDLDAKFALNLENTYKDMSQTMNISVDAVKGLLALNSQKVMSRQIKEASKYSIPGYYAGTTINALLSKLKDGAIGKQFDLIMEALSGAGKIIDSILDLFKSLKDLSKTTESLANNEAEYINNKNNLIVKISELKSKKTDYESTQSDYNHKRQNSDRAESSVADCKNLINAYRNGVNDSDLDIEIRTEIIDYIDDILDTPGKTSLYSDLKDYIKDNTSSDYEIKYTYKSNENKIYIRSLADELKSLNLKEKLDNQTSSNKALSESQRAMNKAQSKIQPAVNAFNNAKSEYISSINKLIADSSSKGSLKKYAVDLDAAISAIKGALNTTASTVASNTISFKKYADEDTNAWKKEKSDLEKKREKATTAHEKNSYTEQIKSLDKKISDNNTIYDNNSTLLKTAEDSLKSFSNSDKVKSVLAKTFYNKALEAIENLKTVKTNVQNLSADSISSSFVFTISKYYYDLSESYSSKSLVDGLRDELWRRIKDIPSHLKKIKSLLNVFTSVYAECGYFNSNLRAKIANGSVTDSLFEEMVYNMAEFSEAADKLNVFGEWWNVFEIFDRAIHLFDNIKTVITSGLSMIKTYYKLSMEIGDNLYNSLSDFGNMDSVMNKAVLALYLTNSLPNRTNYLDGKSAITGMNYSDIARTTSYDNEYVFNWEPKLTNLAKTINQIKKEPAKDNLFCGAELEYILTGGSSEAVNQIVAFFQVYILRVFLDVIPIMMNDFVQELVEEVGSATFGIGGVIVLLAYIFAEPFLDANILALGSSIPIIKRPSKVFLTPEGLPDLLKEFTKIGLTTEFKNSIKEEGKKLVADSKKYKDAQIKEANMTEEEKAEMNEKGSTKNLLDSIKAKYATYLMVFITLEVPQSKILKRFMNLVEMEGKEYYRVKKQSFELPKAYTYMQVDASVDFSPILPLEPISYNAFKTIKISQCRGY